MILETHSTESVTAFELKRRILNVLAEMGEPQAEVTYRDLAGRIEELEDENERLLNEKAAALVEPPFWFWPVIWLTAWLGALLIIAAFN